MKKNIFFFILGILFTLLILQITGNFLVMGKGARYWEKAMQEWADFGNYCLIRVSDYENYDCPDMEEIISRCKCEEFDFGCKNVFQRKK